LNTFSVDILDEEFIFIISYKIPFILARSWIWNIFKCVTSGTIPIENLIIIGLRNQIFNNIILNIFCINIKNKLPIFKFLMVWLREKHFFYSSNFIIKPQTHSIISLTTNIIFARLNLGNPLFWLWLRLRLRFRLRCRLRLRLRLRLNIIIIIIVDYYYLRLRLRLRLRLGLRLRLRLILRLRLRLMMFKIFFQIIIFRLVHVFISFICFI